MNWERVAEHLVQTLEGALANPDTAATEKLEAAFQVASAYGVVRLKQQLADRLGGVVAGGPFAGMRFLGRASEGAYIPKLLGAYEAERPAVSA